ncbi:MAG: AbrB/MazE/SpoVT family DNA-binding domain-containing protein [Phycisphaerales bacterium]|nr:AbrB/MazE/SpoVT family DNA-binding domain-containing protein [Phycisphaerales bacterium]
MIHKAKKQGNGSGMRITKPVTDNMERRNGSRFNLPIEVPLLGDLLARIKPDMQLEIVDWGKPVGKEVW